MKKLLLLLFLTVLLSKKDINAQAYIPFPTANASWIDSKQCQENHYQIFGDTVVNNTTYHKLKMTYRYYQFDQWGDCDYHSSYRIQSYPYQYFGSFRNDSAAKRVYFLPKDSTNEKLLYDFNYNLGDTLRPAYNRSYRFNYPNPLIVTKIDSMLLSGRQHRIVGFTSCSNSTYFGPTDTLLLIEGIGSNSGLISTYNNCNYYMRPSMLYCHQQNNQPIYSDPRGNCNLLTSLEGKLLSQDAISISPNPTTGIINLTTIQNVDFLQLFNLQGKLIRRLDNPSTYFDIGGLDKGLYLLSVHFENGAVQNEKVLLK